MKIRFFPLVLGLFLLAPAADELLAREVHVASALQIKAAIDGAKPGDEIVIAPGTYEINGNLVSRIDGSAELPIVVRAASPRSARLRFGASGGLVEGFKLEHAWWRVEGLEIEGACASDDNCEHAFHLAGAADHFVLRDSVVRDFNAQLKSNGKPMAGVMRFPNDVLIERNVFHDTRARQTANPVTKIDVVGGRRWILRANAIHDFAKAQGDQISYAAFFKGNSSDGVMERNLVRCTWHHAGGTRIGLSLGGGGTAPAFCEGASCATEHRNGTLKNNIIMDCDDVGIYLNKAAATRIFNNTLFATTGIDVRFAASSADIRNNIVSGAIRDRDGASSTRSGNLTGVGAAQFGAWFMDARNADFRLGDGLEFVDRGVAAPDVRDDFCGAARSDGRLDVGAIEYQPQPLCRVDRGGGTPLDVIFADGFD